MKHPEMNIMSYTEDIRTFFSNLPGKNSCKPIMPIKKSSDIVRLRLQNQQLSASTLKNPAEVVQWMGAIQSQDFAAAKWAIGQRMKASSDSLIEKAFNKGEILRTHVLRPTWHFVTPADIRWMLQLTAPRVKALLSHYDRKLGIDQKLIKRAESILTKALQGGKQLDRSSLTVSFEEQGIKADEQRHGHLLMHAELNGLICSGAKKGKQLTYALLDERVPLTTGTKSDKEALAELALRYFSSRGPATIKDFVWWSGLTTTQAAEGLNMIESNLQSTTEDDKTYWFADSSSGSKNDSSSTLLLPNYDEFVVGYTDRSHSFDDVHSKKLGSRGNILFNNLVVFNGSVEGIWKRTISKKEMVMSFSPFTSFTKAQKKEIADAAEKYGLFFGQKVRIEYSND